MFDEVQCQVSREEWRKYEDNKQFKDDFIVKSTTIPINRQDLKRYDIVRLISLALRYHFTYKQLM